MLQGLVDSDLQIARTLQNVLVCWIESELHPISDEQNFEFRFDLSDF